MVLLTYIWPQEWFLRGVIMVMWLVAIIAIVRCVSLRTIAKTNLDMLKKTEDVSFLEEALLKNGIDTNQCFLDYENAKGKSDATEVLFEHLRAIYDAGLKSSRLDADLLVKNSIDKIFTGIDFLRTSISLFLVIGILGTLAGLAISIGGFNGSNFAVFGQTSTTATELSNLFSNLRGAFAPSMWGVFFTIIFVFFYALVIQEGCINRVTEKLTINTIKNWLPVLYPTDFQRGDNSIVKLNATIKNADGINQGVTDLQKNILSSNATLRELTRVATVIKDASDKFDKSSDKVMEIKKLYDDIQKCNEKFNTSLQTIVKSAEDARIGGYDEYVKRSDENYRTLQQDAAKQLQFIQTQIKSLIDNNTSSYNEYTKRLQESYAVVQQNTEKQIQLIQGQITTLAETTLRAYGQYDDKTQENYNLIRKESARQIQIIQEQIKSLSDNTKIYFDGLTKVMTDNQDTLTGVLNELKAYDTNVFQNMNSLQAGLNESVKRNAEAVKILNDLSSDIRGGLNQRLEELSAKINSLQNPLQSTVKEINTLMQGTLKTMQESVEDNRKAFITLAKQMVQNGNMTVPQDTKSKKKVAVDAIPLFRENTAGVEQKLDMLIQAMEENTKQVKKQSAKDNSVQPFWRKHLVAIVIAALLVISVGVQTAIVVKLGNLEQTQVEVNKVLMRGDMNSNGTTGQ